MADGGSAELRAARHALLVPDLMTYWLSGQPGTELTNASITGLLDPRAMTWTAPVAAALGVPTGLFPRFRTPGEFAGPMTASVAAGLGLARPPQVIIGPSHDTAAAVADVPAGDEAVAIRHAVRDAVRVTGRPVSTVHVVGGGVANPLFCQLTADACGLPVVASRS